MNTITTPSPRRVDKQRQTKKSLRKQKVAKSARADLADLRKIIKSAEANTPPLDDELKALLEARARIQKEIRAFMSAKLADELRDFLFGCECLKLSDEEMDEILVDALLHRESPAPLFDQLVRTLKEKHNWTTKDLTFRISDTF